MVKQGAVAGVERVKWVLTLKLPAKDYGWNTFQKFAVSSVKQKYKMASEENTKEVKNLQH